MNTNKLNLKIKEILGEGPKKILMKGLFPFRNRFMLFNVTNFAKKDRVNLDYWLESDNLGDTLTPVIVNHLLSKKNIDPDKKVRGIKHLFAVGSVITAGIQDGTVWGSGILNARLGYRLKGRKLDIRSVRGPFTRTYLADYGFEAPAVYGDPAIFMPEIYTPPIKVEKKYKYGVVMHKDQLIPVADRDDLIVIDICTADYKDFVCKLLSCEKIISSSLHGIILAESYGVPAVLLKPKVDFLKYDDWYYSTKRYEYPVARTIEEGMVTEPLPLPTNLDELRRGQENAFPYDLYEV